ncbi:MAG: phenylacetate--CoA ligase family protein [Promethearchaeota archaeon]
MKVRERNLEFIKTLIEYEKVAGTKILEYLDYLVKTQWLENKELIKLQNKKLREIIKYSYENIPYYHELFKKLSLKPGDIKNREDLTRLPVLTKADIQKNFHKLSNSNLSPEDLISNTTSGSTYTPLRFLIDREMISWSKAAQLRAFQWANFYPWDRFAYFWAFFPDEEQDGVFDLLNKNFNLILPLNCFNLSDEKFEGYYDQIIEFKPKILQAIPNPLYMFAKFLKRRNLELKDLTSIITNAEMITRNQKQFIQEVFKCPVFDVYGARELALIIGECPETQNKHLSMETAITEIIKDGEHVDDGEEGEIIVTNLINYAMPFIRYRVGDIAKQKLDLCECGRGLSLIDSLEGRINDFLLTIDGKYLPGIFFPAVFAYHDMKGIAQYQIRQKISKELEVILVKEKNFQESDLDKFVDIIKRFMGDIELKIKYVNEIPQTSAGKRRYTISELNLKLY